MYNIDNAPNDGRLDLIDITAGIIAAYVSNNSVTATDLPTLVSNVHSAVANLDKPETPPEANLEKRSPTQIRKSITPDALISFIDGKRYKTLKRHLAKNGLSLDEYRTRYGLPTNYPATAASYSAKRSELARNQELGKRRRPTSPALTIVG